MKENKVFKILTLLLIVQWAFIQIISKYSAFVEIYYTNGIYKFISKIYRIVFGWLPFSFGDIFYILIGVYVFTSIYKIIRLKKLNLKNTFFKIGAMASVLFFFFYFNWGLNYYRTPLFESLKIEKKTYEIDELISFTKNLITKTNQAQFDITQSDTLVVLNPSSKKQIRANSIKAYEYLKLKHKNFNFNTPSIKNSIFSIPLTYMGFAGYLNPFTNEAQVNALIPKNNYPSTVCHEIAHQVGIASESEANFVGYLASIHSQDKYFKYSGYLTALKYCLYDVYRNNPEEFETLRKTINPGILRDLENSRKFWSSYQNWSEKFFKIFYDSFLKANKQKDGIKGYNKMVSLLINYYKTEKL